LAGTAALRQIGRVNAHRILVASCVALATAGFMTAGARVAHARRPEVAVQPVVGGSGEVAQKVRREIARSVRSRGLRVTTDIPRAEGTGQYYTWAREAGLRAFVSTELMGRGRRQRATLLVWSGHDGAIVGRWSVVAAKDNLPRVVGRGFWPHLGRSFRRAKLPPEWRQMTPGPTQRIDAGLASDDSITGLHVGRRRPR
jgi:hypothetical protein